MDDECSEKAERFRPAFQSDISSAFGVHGRIVDRELASLAATVQEWKIALEQFDKSMKYTVDVDVRNTGTVAMLLFTEALVKSNGKSYVARQHQAGDSSPVIEARPGTTRVTFDVSLFKSDGVPLPDPINSDVTIILVNVADSAFRYAAKFDTKNGSATYIERLISRGPAARNPYGAIVVIAIILAPLAAWWFGTKPSAGSATPEKLDVKAR
jgi:hypothetical protein